MRASNHILTKGQSIDDKYKVTFFLKKGSYAETYRVIDLEGKTKLLKLFVYSKLHRTQFDENGDVAGLFSKNTVVDGKWKPVVIK